MQAIERSKLTPVASSKTMNLRGARYQAEGLALLDSSTGKEEASTSTLYGIHEKHDLHGDLNLWLNTEAESQMKDGIIKRSEYEAVSPFTSQEDPCQLQVYPRSANKTFDKGIIMSSWSHSSTLYYPRSNSHHRRLQVIGGGAFFLMMLIGAMLCCICCCVKAAQVRRTAGDPQQDPNHPNHGEASPREASQITREQGRTGSGAATQGRSGSAENITPSAPAAGMATIGGHEVGLNLNDIESIRQFITAESGRMVMEELASVLQESRKDYIDSHLVKTKVTARNFKDIKYSLRTLKSIDEDGDNGKENEEEEMNMDDIIENELEENNANEKSDKKSNKHDSLVEQEDVKEADNGTEHPSHPLEPNIGGDDNNATNHDNSDDYGEDEGCCTICLEDYKLGDEVCRSRNAAIAGCTHKFHSHCIKDWLMNHDDCPCCRTNFFNVPDHVVADNDPAEDTIHDTSI
jgi:hypothetical protein